MLSLMRPARPIVWPSASSTVPLALRLVSEGTTNELFDWPGLSSTVVALESSLTDTSMRTLMRPVPSTVGSTRRPTPKSLNSMPTLSTPRGTGTGNSPPERNEAS